jgi:squalene-associated FAD-dependent desaturase
MRADVHIVGGGLAGMAAALDLADAGARVRLYEAAPSLGGRCRSFHDTLLDREIDNGGHVVLSANAEVFGYLERIGARRELVGVEPAAFPFLDLATGERWTIRPNAGPIPWWIMAPGRRVPGTRASDYAEALQLYFAGERARVAERLDPHGPLYQALWVPLATAVLNTDPREAAAQPLASLLAQTFGRGEAACRPFVAANGLSRAFVEPALIALARLGVSVERGKPLDAIDVWNGRATALHFADERVECRDACVLLAVPPHALQRLIPELAIPADCAPIVNAHYRLDRPAELPGGLPILGLVGGNAQWLIARGDVVSVTVSAADSLVDRPPEALAALLWRDVAAALEMPALPVPPARTIKERRATLRLTPAQENRRPGPTTATLNLFLAGDWTQTGVPPTIEGAIRSGRRAARAILQGHPPGSAGV